MSDTPVPVHAADPACVRNRTKHPGAGWFRHAGLGLFIHWGISSLHGSLELSWGMMADFNAPERTVTPRQYWTLADRFHPTDHEPERWITW